MTTKRLLGAFAVIIVLWLILPTLVIVPMSFNEASSFNFPPKGFSTRWYENFFTDPNWMKALFSSLQVAVLTMVIATSVGVLASLGLAKVKFRGKGLLEGYFLLPLIVPGIVLAVGLYSLFLRLDLLGTLPGFVLAHTIVSMPLVITNVMASLQGVDPRLEQASASLGAGRVQTFFSITLPLIAPGVTAGALFAFVTSFDEVILSLFIQSPSLQTLPVKIFNSVTQSNDPTVAAVAVITMLTSVIVMLIAQFATRKRKRPVA
ncbi:MULTISPECIES: ABC transporter permease [unclassified Leucobacter]|uniref:ABC transporter permease n=1 Tax=unclassified Leucobacter TaxID=2621730 RepID=UPI00165D64D2|nr:MULTISPECIES: ABC transporter permease [unclassified Leucobacter]MBC9927878.1 ABC transporter permease [Leucobacter sp. cx-169]MBC9937576.1 ABC transporter permease [Leucobacter sp. cx-87]